MLYVPNWKTLSIAQQDSIFRVAERLPFGARLVVNGHSVESRVDHLVVDGNRKMTWDTFRWIFLLLGRYE